MIAETAECSKVTRRSALYCCCFFLKAVIKKEYNKKSLVDSFLNKKDIDLKYNLFPFSLLLLSNMGRNAEVF